MDFFDLKKQYQDLKPEIDEAVSRVFEAGVFIGGPQVSGFEKDAAAFLGVKYAIGLNSGTDALYLALKALGIGAGDEVIVPDFTFIATAEVVAQCGAVPVFCDIDPVSFNIKPEEIEKKITAKTKAIIPVHLFGRAADMDAIGVIVRDHGLFVVEDAAQSIGAKSGGKFSGTIGDIGCFSFFPTKNLGAFGDGGMLVTNEDQIAQKIKLLRAHGSSPENKYLHLTPGVNSRLDAIQAAILRIKLPYLDKWNETRAANAQKYNNGLTGVGDVVLPKIDGCIFHQYTIRTLRRDNLVKFLKESGIPTMVYYSIPLHLQPAFSYLGGKSGDFPESERAAGEVLSLPIYPEMDDNDQRAVIGKIREFYGNG